MADIARADGQGAAVRHRIARIDDQVQQYVIELVRVDHGTAEVVCDLGDHAGAGGEHAARHIVHLAQQVAGIDHHRLQRLAAREREQVRSELGAALDARQRHLDPRQRRLVQVAGQLEQLQVAADDLQHIVEIVGHAAGELADGFHLLRLLQGRLAGGQLFLAAAQRGEGLVALAARDAGAAVVAHARHQFARIGPLDHVVAGANREGPGLDVGIVFGREQDDGDILRIGMGAQLGNDGEAIETARHAQVDQHHGRIDLKRHVDGAHGIGFVHQLVAGATLQAMCNDVLGE